MNRERKLSVNKFLGLENQPIEIQRTFKIFLLMVVLENIVKGIASSFFILYIIDNQGFVNASIITSILLFLKLLTDYPSGSLSDYIGQSKVLAISYLFYSTGIFLLVIASDFSAFVLVAVMLGLAEAQSSGTIFSWLDSTYQSYEHGNDPDKRNYAFAKTRSRTVYRSVLGIVVMIGGYLATKYSRIFVFKLEATLSLIAIILSLSLLTDQGINNFQEEQDERNGFVDHLKGGISFAVSDTKKASFVLGTAFYDAGWIIWISIILFPFYFGYTGSDQLATLLRSSIFFLGTIVILLTSRLSKMFRKEQIAIAQILHLIVMLGGIIFLVWFSPIIDEFNLGASIIIVILFSISNIISVVVNGLESRLHVDMIPSEYRNSLYSLIPTLSALIAIAGLPIAGTLIVNIGLIGGVFLVLLINTLGSLLLHWSVVVPKDTEIQFSDVRANVIASS